ncbi:hypothetical protein H2201_006429 [Coniosporium apollinis]|uniref:Uncharacterized protein n=2 Tax=Coniosporium TaxID=2810619 RepID=A0ABQ9NP51_9PEZI|nr:hypothetical protein H2199_006067 [Cladosporium sp. JES 115]KAJ9661573.1 hypothetical protein H2201_006429 [Coniosporium apollinis]
MGAIELAVTTTDGRKRVEFICNEPRWVHAVFLRPGDTRKDVTRACSSACSPAEDQKLSFEHESGDAVEPSYNNLAHIAIIRVRMVRRRETHADSPELQYIDGDVFLHDEYVINMTVPRLDRTENPLMTPKMGSALQRIKDLWSCAPHNALPDEVLGPQMWTAELLRMTVKLAEVTAGNFTMARGPLRDAYNERQQAGYTEVAPELSVADVQKAIDLILTENNTIDVPRQLSVTRDRASELFDELGHNDSDDMTSWQVAMQGNWGCSLKSLGELPGRVAPAGYVPCLPQTIRPRFSPSYTTAGRLTDMAKIDKPDDCGVVAMFDWTPRFTHTLAVLSQLLKGYHAYAVRRLERVVQRRQDERHHKPWMRFRVRELMVDDIEELIKELCAEADDPDDGFLEWSRRSQPSYQ